MRAQDPLLKSAIKQLSIGYSNVYREFCASGLPRLRLLPISGSIFAGDFKCDMANMTAAAMAHGFDDLGDSSAQKYLLKKSTVELCIFAEAEHPYYERAFSEAAAI